MKIQNSLGVLLLAMIVSACTWVQLTAEGEKVRVLSDAEVTQCTLVGQTTANTTEKLAGVKRHDNALEFELTSLARNSAANLGGDTIVPAGSIVDGKQTFKVYRCVPQ